MRTAITRCRKYTFSFHDTLWLTTKKENEKNRKRTGKLLGVWLAVNAECWLWRVIFRRCLKPSMEWLFPQRTRRHPLWKINRDKRKNKTNLKNYVADDTNFFIVFSKIGSLFIWFLSFLLLHIFEKLLVFSVFEVLLSINNIMSYYVFIWIFIWLLWFYMVFDMF